MKEPLWIDVPDALALQEELISRFGGLPGVRDDRLLDSALHRPLQMRAYGKPSLHQLAAAYASGIARNHPFLDGNKRMAFMTAALFLELNGRRLAAPEEEVAVNTLALAAGTFMEEQYAEWLRLRA